MTDDSELLRRFSEGQSQAAFRELLERHVGLVYSAARRRLGADEHLAHDVAQQVFVCLAQQAGSLQHHRVLAAWLHTATRYTAARVVRTEQRRRAREQEALMSPDPVEPPVNWSALRPVLDAAIDDLPSSDREALLLRFFQAKGIIDIGRALNVSEDAARKRVDRALERLRSRLARQGIVSTTSAMSLVLAENAVAAAPNGLIAAISNAVGSMPAPVASASLLQFMTNAKLSLGIVALVVVVAVGTSTYQLLEARNADRVAAEVRRVIGVLSVRLNEIDEAMAERANTPQSSPDHLARDAEAAEKRKRATSPPSAVAMPPETPKAVGARFVATHPEALAYVADYYLARWQERYAALFKQLGLTPSQVEQFMSLLLRSDGGVRWHSFPDEGVAEFNVTEQGLTIVERNGQLQALLGEQGFRAYLDFERAQPARQVVAQLAQSTFRNDALAHGQADALLQILLQNSPEYAKGGGVNVSSIDWAEVLNVAGSTLRESQKVALAALREKLEFEQTLRRAISEAQAQAITAKLEKMSGAPR